jgi:GPH family glycoside/pentoside/hexuronide:cation symporter
MALFGKDYDFTYKGLTSSFLMAGTVLTIIGVVLTPRISRIFGKSMTYAVLLGVAGISSGLFYFLGPDDIILMFVFQLITSFAVGPVSVLQWAIYTDTADYSEWKTGRRATGLVMSASLFALKMGIALGVAGLAWILAAYGYEANQEQTEKGLMGIRMVMSVYPAVFAVIGMVIMFFYPLKKHMMMQVETELVARRQQHGSEETPEAGL